MIEMLPVFTNNPKVKNSYPYSFINLLWLAYLGIYSNSS